VQEIAARGVATGAADPVNERLAPDASPIVRKKNLRVASEGWTNR
jgi:hypothetical protein